MKKLLSVLLVGLLGFSFVLAGCVKKEASSSAAIEQSKALTDAKAKVDYLMQQAGAFYNSKQFQDAINVAQYVLNYVDKNSAEAKSLLQKATDALKAKAEAMSAEMQKTLDSLGK